MTHSDKILDHLIKGAKQGLNADELKFLKNNLQVEEIEDYSEMLGAYLVEQENISPSAKVKDNLMQHFHKAQENQPKRGLFLRPLFIKFSAAAIFILAVGTTLYFLFPNNEPIKIANETNELMNMEFTETEEIENDEMKEETRYLLHVDFFSNSSLIR